MFIGRLVPWWIFALIAVWMSAVAFQTASSASETNSRVDAALGSPAADPVAMAIFDSTAIVPPLDEFAVTGFDYAYVGPFGDNQAILFVHSSGQPGVYVAFTEYNPMGITLEGAFAELNEQDGASVLRGVLREQALANRTFATLLEAENLPPAQVIYFADILRGDRDVALGGYRQRSTLMVWIPAIFALACAAAALVKFRAWRRRRAAA